MTFCPSVFFNVSPRKFVPADTIAEVKVPVEGLYFKSTSSFISCTFGVVVLETNVKK